MMLRNVRLPFLLVAVVSALLGYAAASGKLNPFQKADAGPTEQPQAAAAAAPGCCSDGLFRAGMVALANHNDAVADKAAKDGKKSNILVIFADDVGVWNVSAYHRGMMGGRTPNIFNVGQFLDALQSSGSRAGD